MPKPSRSLEEIVDLQDKAISALTQANLALQLALEAIQAARREVGTPQRLPGFPVGVQPSFPYTSPSQPQFVMPNGNGGIFIGGSNAGVWNNGLPAANGYSVAEMKDAMVTLTNTGKTLSGSAEMYKGFLENWKSEYEKLSEEPAAEGNTVTLKGCVQ